MVISVLGKWVPPATAGCGGPADMLDSGGSAGEKESCACRTEVWRAIGLNIITRRNVHKLCSMNGMFVCRMGENAQ